MTLLDALRERRLTGTKKGRDRGQCGAYTVHVDDRRALSCLTLAATLRGKEVTTIEGIADGDEPYRHDAGLDDRRQWPAAQGNRATAG